MNYVRYRLQPYSGVQSRHRCPGCRHRNKTFTRYIHPDTGEQLAPHVGLCDRVLKCGYHFTPRQYFAASGIAPARQNLRLPKAKLPQPTSYISTNVVNNSLDHYQHNNFVLYLINKLGIDVADTLVKRYRIGTSTRWPGATVFWQIDVQGKVRTGKIMLYHRRTGKRVKKPYNHVTWMHRFSQQWAVYSERLAKDGKAENTENRQPKTKDFNLKQCLFGEHLLINNDAMPIAIVESEKTAIVSSAYMPAFIWLATGGLDGLDASRFRALQNRKVILFPDANGFNKWRLKANELQRKMPGTIIKVSDAVELIATEAGKKEGIDLGDLLLGDACPDKI